MRNVKTVPPSHHACQDAYGIEEPVTAHPAPGPNGRRPATSGANSIGSREKMPDIPGQMRIQSTPYGKSSSSIRCQGTIRAPLLFAGALLLALGVFVLLRFSKVGPPPVAAA